MVINLHLQHFITKYIVVILLSKKLFFVFCIPDRLYILVQQPLLGFKVKNYDFIIIFDNNFVQGKYFALIVKVGH